MVYNDEIAWSPRRLVEWRMYQAKLMKNKNPLIISLFFLLLAGLFLITALMDIRRTRNTLLDVFENKGLTIIKTIEMIARSRLENMYPGAKQITAPFQDFANIEKGFRIKEAVLSKLIDSAKELDRSYDTDQSLIEEFKAQAKNVRVRAVCFLDASGTVLFQSASIPNELKDRLKILTSVTDDVFLDFHMESMDRNVTHMVAVKRENKPGRIVLFFDRNDLQYWTSQIIFQEVIEERGWQKGIQYFILVDSLGRILAGAGDLPKTVTEDILSYFKTGPFESRPSNRHIRKEAPDLLEVYVPLQIKGMGKIIALAGINIEEVRQLGEKNKAHVLFTTGIIIFSAGLVLFLFYRTQALHFNRLQRMREKLIQAERLSSLGKLAAGVAHEIRNPLNAVSMSVQRIFREFAPVEPENKKQFSYLVSIVRDEISRLNRIIEAFVEPARIKSTGFKAQRLEEFLDRVVRLARAASDPMDIEIKCQVTDPELIVYMDAAKFQQAIWNFIKNAQESIQGMGTITFEAFARDSRNAVIQISDTGVGISEETLKRVLEFEYTTKEKGLGLGLPIAQEIILAHGGDMIIESTPGQGTIIQIVLPMGKNKTSVPA